MLGEVLGEPLDPALLGVNLAVGLVVDHIRELTPGERDGAPGEDEGRAAVRMLHDLLRLDKVGALTFAVTPTRKVSKAQFRVFICWSMWIHKYTIHCVLCTMYYVQYM